MIKAERIETLKLMKALIQSLGTITHVDDEREFFEFELLSVTRGVITGSF